MRTQHRQVNKRPADWEISRPAGQQIESPRAAWGPANCRRQKRVASAWLNLTHRRSVLYCRGASSTPTAPPIVRCHRQCRPRCEILRVPSSCLPTARASASTARAAVPAPLLQPFTRWGPRCWRRRRKICNWQSMTSWRSFCERITDAAARRDGRSKHENAGEWGCWRQVAA